jgi:hypothetical protein
MSAPFATTAARTELLLAGAPLLEQTRETKKTQKIFAASYPFRGGGMQLCIAALAQQQQAVHRLEDFKPFTTTSNTKVDF